MNRKQFTFGIIAGIVIAAIIYVWSSSPTESHEESVVSPTPREEDEDNSIDHDYAIPKEHERMIFFIENPKYEIVNEQLLKLFEDDFPYDREKWEDYSYILINYLYKMMTGDLDNIESVFKPEDPDQVEQLAEENKYYYEEVQIDDLIFYSDSRNGIMLLSITHNVPPEDEERSRLLVFDTKKEMITLDKTIAIGQIDEFLNFYFDLPPIEDFLEQEKYAHLHASIMKQINGIAPDFTLGERLADSVIYYLHGMMTENVELVSYFLPSTNEGALRIMEHDMLFYKPLKSYEIELVNIEKNEGYPEMHLNLRFHQDDDNETINISVQLFHLLFFNSYWENKHEIQL